MTIVMKNLRIRFVAIGALAIFVVVVPFIVNAGRGQSRSGKNRSSVKSTARITTPPAVLAAAADRNAILKNELDWTFGGKQQRGWYLYDQLIRQTLDTQSDSAAVDFAVAVASWQKRNGLTADGVLDVASLMTMISQWQNSRLKDRTLATPDQLVTPPANIFFDPERAADLRQIESHAYAAYKQMVAAAIADRSLHLAHSSARELAPSEKYFKIISAFRSREYQDRLRRESPNAGSAGLAVNSPHFTGRALDLYVGGDPVDSRDSNRAIQVNTPAYKWLVRNAGRFGFRPYFYEPWHWEYVR
jgi:zinc D-Ala-D-Ala carboxypeptidase